MSDPTSTNAEPDGIPVTDVRSMRRGFSGWGASALAFTSIRPLIGFSLAALLIKSAGLASWLALAVLLMLMMVVAAVFGALSSRWPLEGSVASWSRQLIGPRAGLLVGWAYVCSYLLFMSSLAFFDTQRILYSLGLPAPDHLAAACFAVVIIAVTTILNSVSRRLQAGVMYVAGAVSIGGVLVFGTLLITHAQRGFGDLVRNPNASGIDWAWWTGPFLAALAFASATALRGFEMPAEVAEEVPQPRRTVPRAMLWTLLVGGLVTLYGVIAVAVSVPGADAVSGEFAQNPYASTVVTAVEQTLGLGPARILSALLVVATFAAGSLCQLAASRTLWTMARDREVPKHSWLSRLSARERLPRNALITVGVIGAILPFLLSAKAAFVLAGVSAAPLMLAFVVPLIGLITARRRDDWAPGPWSPGRWLEPLSIIGAVAVTALGLNVLWPREAQYGEGSSAWHPLIIFAAVVVAGLILMAWAFRDNGAHVRKHDHVDRDLHQRILLAHTGTCSVCHRGLAHGEEVFWNPEAHVTICATCAEDVVV